MVVPFIKRDAIEALWKDLGRREIAFLIGPRQAGKTTIMQRIEQDLRGAGEKTLFLSLDFDRDRVFFVSQERLIKKIALEFGNSSGYVFIDEIQHREDAGRFLKGLQDMGLPYKFIVSGSGSVDLKARIKESMVGRKRRYDIFPLSLREFVNFKTAYLYADRIDAFVDLASDRASDLLLEYLDFGGFPRVVLEPQAQEKQREMDEIFQGAIYKDIAALVKVEKIDAFGELIRTLASQAGKIINYSELSATLGLSLPTVKNYIQYAEQTYILQRLTPFHRNIRSEITKAPAVYFFDPGLRNFALGVFGHARRTDSIGFAFQNLVYLILRDKLRFSGARIHFWRTTSKTEIDFIVDTGHSLIPIEVKFQNLSRPIPPRAFEGFSSKYAPPYGLVINKTLRTAVSGRHMNIHFITIWDLITIDLIDGP